MATMEQKSSISVTVGGKEEGVWSRDLNGTHKEVGKEKRPFESIPTEARSRATTLLSKQATLETIIVFITISWHTGLTAAKGLTSSATLWSWLKTPAAVLKAIVKDCV
jgi:hypothetical protein